MSGVERECAIRQRRGRAPRYRVERAGPRLGACVALSRVVAASSVAACRDTRDTLGLRTVLYQAPHRSDGGLDAQNCLARRADAGTAVRRTAWSNSSPTACVRGSAWREHDLVDAHPEIPEGTSRSTAPSRTLDAVKPIVVTMTGDVLHDPSVLPEGREPDLRAALPPPDSLEPARHDFLVEGSSRRQCYQKVYVGMTVVSVSSRENPSDRCMTSTEMVGNRAEHRREPSSKPSLDRSVGAGEARHLGQRDHPAPARPRRRLGNPTDRSVLRLYALTLDLLVVLAIQPPRDRGKRVAHRTGRAGVTHRGSPPGKRGAIARPPIDGRLRAA